MASPYSAVFRDRNLAVILLLGFSSGLPLALTGGTLQALTINLPLVVNGACPQPKGS